MKLPLFTLLSLFTMPVVAATGVGLDSMLSLLIYLVIIGLVFYAIWWFLGYVGIPEPFNKIIRAIVGLVALIIVINLLLGLVGRPMF